MYFITAKKKKAEADCQAGAEAKSSNHIQREVVRSAEVASGSVTDISITHFGFH